VWQLDKPSSFLAVANDLSDRQTASLLTRIKHSQASDEVASQLRRLITEGGLKEGDRLPSEYNLSTTFGVSRPIVREALRELRSLGLVVSKTGSGTFVASTVPRPLLLGYTVDELHEVRSHLEVPGAGFAAERRTEQQLADLEAIVQRMLESDDRRTYAELDAAFHAGLARCSANSLHVRLVGELHELIIENSDVVMVVEEQRRPEGMSEHREILDAVRKQDAPAAREAMARHLRGATRPLRTGLDGESPESDGPR
jgi:GntR family transcriptional regulator, transcriptional repressor for pyruvate dehydrogenase complex